MARPRASAALPALATFALAGLLALYLAPGAARGFSLLGSSLDVKASGTGYQRDVRIFDNGADSVSHDNTTPEAAFPGALGAALAVWKGAAAWNSSNPAAARNFDMDWQGLNDVAGGPTNNTVSWITNGGCGGGVLAYTEPSPLQNGWRIRFCDNFTWNDGPGSISGSHYDIQGVMAHEYGHALGLDHSNASCACGGATATMCPFTCNGSTAQRTIEPDDQAGLQTIYGALPADKPLITSVSGSTAVGGTLTVHGSNFAELVHVKFSAGTSVDIDVPGVVYDAPSVDGTSVTVEIPAQARTGNVLVWRPGTRLSNPWPIVIEPVGLWNDLGGGTTGSNGAPTLEMGGPLTASSTLSLDLEDGRPGALALLFLSFSSTPADFLGGRLHAFPLDVIVFLGTDGAGEIHGSTLFGGAPAGTQIWFQIGIDDPTVPVYAASLSNAVRGTVP